MSSNTAPFTNETDILNAALAALAARLPAAWRTDVEREAKIGRYRADAVITIAGPTGDQATLYAEARRSVVTRDLRSCPSTGPM